MSQGLRTDVPVSAPQTLVAQLEATIRSAHALLQAGLIDEATSLLVAFSTEVQPKIDRALTEVRSEDLEKKKAKRARKIQDAQNEELMASILIFIFGFFAFIFLLAVI